MTALRDWVAGLSLFFAASDIPACAAENIDAGPIWNNADAGTKCPAVCTSHGRTWTGNWHTTVQGQMSRCECTR